MSRDPCVWYLAEKGLQHYLTLSRKKFKASVVVRNALAEDPNQNRKSLVSAAKRATQQAEDVRRETELKSLEKQGQMIRWCLPVVEGCAVPPSRADEVCIERCC